ncbi:MAG: helix-turn-helix transcriptional regulator [SAR324 cluster bacterium]
MISDSRLMAVVGRIYDAALAPELWPAVLKEAAELVQAPAGVLAYQDLERAELGWVQTNGRDRSCWKSYNEYYGAISPYVGMMKQWRERSYATQEVMPDADLVRTEYYNDWLMPQDIHYHAGAVVLRTDQAAAFVEFQLSKARGPFTQEARTIIDLLAPHFRRAIGVGLKLGAAAVERASALSALDKLKYGVILLDERGRVAHLNAAAERWVRAGLGLAATPRGLRAFHPEEDGRLRRLIAGSIGAPGSKTPSVGGSVTLHSRGAAAPLHITVSPLRAEGSGFGLAASSIRAVAFLSDGAPSASVSGALRTIYGLTPAETRVAEALLEGDGPASIADRFEVSRETVRTQTKSIYGKTGVNSQGRFIQLALTHPAALLREEGGGEPEDG